MTNRFMTLIQKINPINKESEKKKFFFDPLYNPQFQYATSVLHEELHYYTPISSDYLPIAHKILDFITKTYGSHDAYIEKTHEPILTREEVEKIVRDYLSKEHIEKMITMKFSTDAVARTSMVGNTLTIRLPVSYNESGLMGMLNHDVGTHFFRTLNERKQPWYGQREKFHIHPYLLTEEGLAVLHAFLPKSHTLFRRQAIYYIAVHYANEHSFVETNEMLKKYVSDKEDRWKFCLRAKRGIKDTSQPGAFSKDQTYFAGAVKVWRWLKKHDFDTKELFVGKISIDDVDTLKSMWNTQGLVFPTFLTENTHHYKEKLLKIGKENFFEKSV
ncbi:hypothetical protein C5B42_00660 [Candidatus Cerribacteria bacterium 'Amazon FNV 2010 28 9']|uniref:DUF1704 domain-containing protein n=1 Tax=Candidatus Cerribacteria bacterium 'Amazon FNV 2010 28 9' TaxID=2081795 RepID=A0A317JQC9_9BACT|nr:MAG: hypothetical protein C5B42_00660 [Candidatus Cerribacteria bacterium 'Amazon FNV 2010 28 9']